MRLYARVPLVLFLLLFSTSAFAQLAPPQVFAAAYSGYDEVVLSWLEPNTNDEVVQYWIYRNGVHRYIVDAPATEYTLQLPESGNYTFSARALYDGGVSPHSNEVSVTWYDPGQGSFLETFEYGIPDSWTIEANIATSTWAVHQGGLDAPFPTDYVSVSGDAQFFNDSYDRLTTPLLDMSEATEVAVRFEMTMTDFQITVDRAQVIVEVGRTEHQVAQWIDQTLPVETYTYDISQYAAGHDDVKISFYHTAEGFFLGGSWALDNVEVITDIGNDQPVRLNMIPAITEVAAAGGAIYYDLQVTSTLDVTVPGLSYWNWVTLPDGGTVGPLPATPWTLTPMMDVTLLALGVAVPGFAPPGDYVFHGGAGFFPTVTLSDEFPFHKAAFTGQGMPGSGQDGQLLAAAGWTLLGDSRLDGVNRESAGEEASVSALPTTPRLSMSGPNPFNPSTALTLTLPQAAEARVVLVNTLGQQVAELAPSGQLGAGQHRLQVDGSQLASGVYLVQAEVAGQHLTRKLVLMK